MFSEKIRKHRNSLSFQLTVRYASLFTLSLIVTLAILYCLIHSTSMREMDENLMEEIKEMILMMNSGGIEKVKDYMIVEVETEDEDTFYRLYDANGEMLDRRSNYDWKAIDNPRFLAPHESREDYPLFETVRLDGYPDRIRMASSSISGSEIMQVGKSMAETDRYIFVLRDLMALIGIPLICVSALLGWKMARHALRDVEAVTLTAGEISGGAFERRVPAGQRPDEIARLAETFNTMVDRLQAVMKSMGETNDNIAHDLRSPLARIRGFAEMALMKSSGPEDYEKMAVNTIEECDHLISLINTMLDITEMEAGAGEFNAEAVDVVRVVSEACELFDPVALENNIRLIRNSGEGSLVIRTDRGKLQRLVVNLLENAIKYTLSGGVVTVSVKRERQRISIIFEDTGMGIPESDLPRIFDRFYRCDRSRSRSGIGLGLSLARAIANALGGEISAKSVENEGSTFVFSLPV